MLYQYIVLLLSKECSCYSDIPETNHTPSNLRSQWFESSATPAFIFVVVYSAVRFMGVANPKAALQSKASSASPIFRVIHPIGGSARNYGPHAQSTDSIHSHMCIVVLNAGVGMGLIARKTNSESKAKVLANASIAI